MNHAVIYTYIFNNFPDGDGFEGLSVLGINTKNKRKTKHCADSG